MAFPHLPLIFVVSSLEDHLASDLSQMGLHPQVLVLFLHAHKHCAVPLWSIR